MIRINLLGVPKPKHGKRAAAAVPSMGGEGPSPIIAMVLLVVLGLAGNGWYWWKLGSEKDRLAEAQTKAEADKLQLAQTKARYDEAQRQEAFFRKRSDEIDLLKKNQSGPVNLLTMVGDTVNGTEQVWLLAMREEGNTINIEGTALSANAVANLIANLKKTNYFKTVEIKETFQDDTQKEMQAFQFTLVCEKQQEKKS